MRVLVLTHRLPYAPNKGDRLRVFHMLKALAGRADVDLVSFVHDEDEAGRAEAVPGVNRVYTVRVSKVRNFVRGVAILAGRTPLTHALLDAPAMNAVLRRIVSTRRPDVVFAYCSGMARFALEPPLAGLPFVLDMVDVDSQKWAALGATTPGPLGWVYAREARVLARFEARAAEAAHTTLVVNARELAALRAVAPGARGLVLENGVDVCAFRPPGPPANDDRVVFCGVFSYRPNVDGALWFAREAWPLVRRQRPSARLYLVGADPAPAVRALAEADPSIVVTGTVPDVREYVWQASVAVAPLMTARGVQNKVLEAAAAGVPSVVTGAVAAGLPPEVEPACRVADSAWGFASAVLDLLERSPEERRAMANQADIAVLDWRSQLSDFPELLVSAAGSPARSEVA